MATDIFLRRLAAAEDPELPIKYYRPVGWKGIHLLRAVVIILIVGAFGFLITNRSEINRRNNTRLFCVNAHGADPDGTAFGTLAVDQKSGLVTWNIVYGNLETPTAFLILGPRSESAPVVGPQWLSLEIGLSVSGPADTLHGAFIHPTPISIVALFANPSAYTLVIRTATYPTGNGAVHYVLGGNCL